MEIAQKIKQLRMQLDLQQQETAAFMGLTRQTYALVESGKKDLTLPELEKLAGFLHSSIAELLFGPKIIDENAFNRNKYDQIVLNCLYYGGNEWGAMTKHKLAKLVCLVDLEWYRKTGTSMLGRNYVRYVAGPEPDHFYWTVDGLYTEGRVNIEYKSGNILVSGTEKPSVSELDAIERLFIKNLAEEWAERSTYDLSNHVSRQVSWKLAHTGAYVPYDFFKPKV